MSLIDDIRADANKRLQITHGITGKVGTQINVGEKFTSSFVVKNTDTTVAFKNVKLKVSKTEFATPVGGAQLNFNLATQLNPGNAAGVSVQFTATQTLDEFIPASESPTGKPIVLFASEPFAELEVLADVDIGNVTGLSKFSSAEVDIRK